jgi:hypothetical protein
MPNFDLTEYRTIILRPYGGDIKRYTLPVLVQPPIKTGRTKVFPGRATMGPTDPDRDDTLTTLNFMDVSGGMGVYTINPASDLNKYWWGVASAEGTDGFTSAREVINGQPDSFSGNCVPVGRIGQSTYALWGTALHRWDPDTQTWGAAQQTIGTVVNTEGIARFAGKVWFPLGPDGYASIDEASLGTLNAPTIVAGAATPTYSSASPTTNPKVYAFIAHQQNLYAITTAAEGYALASSLTGGTGAWLWHKNTALSTFVKIEASFEPKAFAVFPNQQQGKSLWVSGRRGLMVYDDSEMAWIESSLIDVPPHPSFGRAMAVFRPGESLWVAGGGGDAIQYTAGGTVVPASGPGGVREGMPASKRGDIVSWATDLHRLYGLTAGEGQPEALTALLEAPDPDTLEVVELTGGGEDVISGSVSGSSTVIGWNGKGWHPVWESDEGETASPTKIVVSDAVTSSGAVDYRAFWGVGEECYSVQCRLTTHSSVQAIQTGTGERFAAVSYLEWGRFTGGSIANHKLISHAAIIMEHATEDEYVEFQYYTDHEHQDPGAPDPWITLGVANTDQSDYQSRTVLPFGLTDDGQFSEGINLHWIRPRLAFYLTNPLIPPIVTSLTLAFLPVPQDAATKAYTIPLPVDRDEITGKTAEQIIEIVEELFNPEFGEEKFYLLQDREKLFRVYLSGLSYGRIPTSDGPGALTLTIIQIPTGAEGLVGEP